MTFSLLYRQSFSVFRGRITRSTCRTFTRNMCTALNTTMSAPQKPEIVFVLGSPGAGKGTQCKNIVDQFGYVHLSAGDLLREERNRPDSKYAELIEEHIRRGLIVPVAITCSLLERAMERFPDSNKFLIDGFPRDKENLRGWTESMACNVNLRGVLFLDCPEDVSIKRCLNRGLEGSGRSDDNLDSLRKRFATYLNDTMPIVDYYDNLHLVHRVDASRTQDLVFEDVKRIFLGFQTRDFV